MTCEELIEELKKYPPEAKIVMRYEYDSDGIELSANAPIKSINFVDYDIVKFIYLKFGY